MMRRSVFVTLLMTVLFGAIGACERGVSLPEGIARVEPVSAQERLVRAFIDAFNAHDPDAMAALCTDTIEWASVSGSAVSVAGSGTDDLVTQMAGYFDQTRGVASAVENLISNGDTVALTERVTWKPRGSDVERTQSSLAVYQIRGERIAAVWYFPVQE